MPSPPYDPVAEAMRAADAPPSALFNQDSSAFSVPTGSTGATPSMGETMEQMLDRAEKHSNAGSPRQGGTDIYPASEVTSRRYPYMLPGHDNEDLYGSAQHWYGKAFNGLSKGVVTTGTTFVNSTLGLVDGAMEWAVTGKFSSMWDNHITRAMDEVNTRMEDYMPNYYTAKETNAAWYSPDNLLTANFFWDKFVKTLGTVAGAALAGGVYSSGLKALGLGARLTAAGRMGAALAETEAAAIAGEGVNGVVIRLAKAAGKLGNIDNALDVTNRFVTSGLATSGEAAMEAIGTANSYRETAIMDFKEANGRYPNAHEMSQIDRDTESVGNSSMMMNMALLTATNYFQFPKILNTSWGAAKSIDNSIMKNVMLNDAGKLAMKAGPKTLFGKSIALAGKVAKVSFSPSEAFEEISQMAIEKGTQNYWNKHHRGEGGNFLLDILNNPGLVGSDMIVQGYTDALNSKEGMESLLLGGVTGGVVEGVGGAGANRRKRQTTKEAIAAINSRMSIPEILGGTGILKDRNESLNRTAVHDQELQNHVEQGNEKEARDVIYDEIHNTLSTRIKYGAFDQVTAELEMYRQISSTEEGFNQLQKEGKANATDTRESFQARIAYLTREAKSMNDLHKGLNVKYGGITDDEGNKRYTPSVIAKLVYSASKLKNIDERMSTLSSELGAMRLDPMPIIEKAFKTQSDTMFDVWQQQILQLDPALTPEQMDEAYIKAADMASLYADRKLFTHDYRNIKEFPELYQEEQSFKKLPTPVEAQTPPDELPPEQVASEGQAVVEGPYEDTDDSPRGPLVKNRFSVMQEGKDYYLTDVSMQGDKVGRKLPPFKVIAKNPDGTISVQNILTNERTTIGEGDLAPYTIHSVNGARKTKTGAWFLEHVQDIYRLKLGRGETVDGRLTFDPTKNQLFFSYVKGGKLLHRQITNYDLVAQKGFREARLTPVGKAGPQSEQEASLMEGMEEEQDAFAADKIDKRRTIVGELISQTVDSLAEVDKSLTKTKDRLAQLSTLSSDPKKTISPEDIGKLIREKEALTKTLSDLEDQKAELEYQLGYFKDVVDRMDELPGDTREFSRYLRDTVRDLQGGIKKLEDSLTGVQKIIKELEDLISSTIATLKEGIAKFFLKNPAEYTLEETEMGLVLSAHPNLLEFPQAAQEDLKIIQEAIRSTNEELIPEGKAERSKLFAQIDEVRKQIEPVQRELNAAQAVYDQFKKVYAEHLKKQRDAEAMKRDVELQNTIATNQEKAQVNSGDMIMSPEEQETAMRDYDNKTAITEAERIYRKAINVLFNATTQGTDEEERDYNTAERNQEIKWNNEHQEFLGKINMHPNWENIRRQPVSSLNQTDAGVTGLIPASHPYSAHSVAADPSKAGKEIIYFLYREQDKKTSEWHFLDKDGNRTTDVQKMVRGIMPTSSLTWTTGQYAGQPRYSRATPEVAAIYAAEAERVRNSITASTTAQDVHAFHVSRGIAVKDKTGRHYPIVGSLLTERDLDSMVLKVVTGDNNKGGGILTHGKMEIGLRAGSVMVQNGATLEYANNRKFTKREQELLRKVFIYYARRAQEGMVQTDGSILRGLDETVTKFLQGVLYYQHPVKWVKGEKEVQVQPMGRHQFYLEAGELFFWNGTVGVPFNAAILEDQAASAALTAFLSTAYHNVNSSFLKNPRQFTEIVDVNPDGTLKVRTWKSYQHYLISENAPDGTKRGINDIPLYTTVIPENNGGNTPNVKSRYSYNVEFTDPPNAPAVEMNGRLPTPPHPGAPKGTHLTMEIEGVKIQYTVSGDTVTVWNTPETVKPLIDKATAYVQGSILENYNAVRAEDKLPPYATFDEIEDPAVKEKLIPTIMTLIANKVKTIHDRLEAEKLARRAGESAPEIKTVEIMGTAINYTGSGDNIEIVSEPETLDPLLQNGLAIKAVQDYWLKEHNSLKEVIVAATYGDIAPELQLTLAQQNQMIIDQLVLPNIKIKDAVKYPPKAPPKPPKSVPPHPPVPSSTGKEEFHYIPYLYKISENAVVIDTSESGQVEAFPVEFKNHPDVKAYVYHDAASDVWYMVDEDGDQISEGSEEGLPEEAINVGIETINDDIHNNLHSDLYREMKLTPIKPAAEPPSIGFKPPYSMTFNVTGGENAGKQLEFNIDESKLEDTLVEIDGKKLFLGMHGRLFVLARVGNTTIPFYVSSEGTSGKEKGKWYPFFGQGSTGWIIKGTLEQMEKDYGSPEIAAVADKLNTHLKIPTGFVSLEGEFKADGKVVVDIKDHISFGSYPLGDKWADGQAAEFNSKMGVSVPDSIAHNSSDGIDEHIRRMVDAIGTPQPATSASVGTMFTNQMVADLRALGLTPAQINKLTPNEAHDIINGVIPVPKGTASFLSPTATQAQAEIERLDDWNVSAQRQKINLTDYLNRGLITYLDENGNPC